VLVLTGLQSSFDHLEGGVGFEMQNIPRERYTASRPRQLQTVVYRQEVVLADLQSRCESTTQIYPLSYLDTRVLFMVKKGKCYDLEAYIKAVAPGSGRGPDRSLALWVRGGKVKKRASTS
jgi:hypothetical protein